MIVIKEPFDTFNEALIYVEAAKIVAKNTECKLNYRLSLEGIEVKGRWLIRVFVETLFTHKSYYVNGTE